MNIWLQLRWLGKDLQIAPAIVGGGISTWLLDGPEPWVKPFVMHYYGYLLQVSFLIHGTRFACFKLETKRAEDYRIYKHKI